jgi:hypothetical protein
MGWLFSPRWQSREELLDHLVSPFRWGPNFKIIKSTHVGNNHWYVCKRSDGVVFIGLDMMQNGGNEGWGYKDLCAGDGPVEVNCPLSLLKLAPDSGGHETAWREQVQAYHARKKAEKAKRLNMVAGTCIRFSGRLFRLIAPYPSNGRTNAWMVEELCSQRNQYVNNWKMSAQQLTKSEIVEEPA